MIAVDQTVLSGRARQRALRAVRFAQICGVVMLTVSAATAHAQLAVDKTELVLDPTGAQQRVGVFTVKNNGRAPVQATVSLADWDRDESGENRFYPLGKVVGSCGKALSISPAAVILQPGSTQEVRVALDSATADALRADECWSIAFLETTQTRDSTRGRVVNYIVRTGVKLYVAPPQLKPDAEITSLKLGPRARQTSDSAQAAGNDIMLAVRNTGTRHTVAQATVEFRRPDNTVAAKISTPDLYMLPGASMQVSVPAPELPRGRYVVLAIVDYHGDELAAAQAEYEVP